METATGKAFSDTDRASLVPVSDELSIVNSGLEDTMTIAYEEIRETLRQRPALEDLRTAAFFMVIEKIAHAYVELGIFP